MLKEMRKIDECDPEKTIAILGDRWWPQTAKQKGDKINKTIFLEDTEKKRKERPNVGGTIFLEDTEKKRKERPNVGGLSYYERGA